MPRNGGDFSWGSSRQDSQEGFTLSSSETEFVAASQPGKEVVCLRVLFRAFRYPKEAYRNMGG